MTLNGNNTVEMIPIDQITVVNPRSRGRAKFRQITDNIAKLGLKRPITLARRTSANGSCQYDLVCGQRRLEACRANGSTVVPAIVLDVTREQLLLMSLVENLARKRNTTIDLAKEIAAMKERGIGFEEIARRTNLDDSYVRGIVLLLNNGERGLLQAVEHGHIPISVAITIASSGDEEVQQALAEAYESKHLRGKALLKARRLIDLRRVYGKNMSGHRHNGHVMSADKLVKAYQMETSRQRMVVQKAKKCEMRLMFIVSALKSLFQNENFVNLLRAESLDSLPQYLADQIKGKNP